MAKKKQKTGQNTIALNKKAKHDYFIEQRLEAGIALQGWEVKSLRAGRLQLTESHVILKHGEAFLLGAQIVPLPTASKHMEPDPTRTRKLLLHRQELDKLVGHIKIKGYTIVALAMYWKHGLAKVEIGLAKGKKQHDKREAVKKQDVKRDLARVMKHKG